MTRPTVHTRTEAFYARLPDVYREADATLDLGAGDLNGYPLLRWLSLLVDQLGEVADLIGRIDYYSPDDRGLPGDTSDLGDPATADAAWLPWLAQAAGVVLAPNLNVDDQRAAIAGAVTGYLKGTKQGIADAAATALTGTRYVRVIPLYGGDQWRIEVRTRTTETPSTADVLAAIVDKRAKPAGVEIVPTTYAATWDQLEALGSWDALEARGSWTGIEETGAP
jgi:Phage tail protein (Tail_P2_I)